MSTVSGDAIGLLEIGSWTASMAGIDAAEKAADIRVLQIELNDLLGVSIKLAGDTSSIKAALNAAEETSKAMKATVITHAINRPHKNSSLLWPLKEEFNPLIEQNVVHLPREKDMSDNTTNVMGAQAIGLIETQGFSAVIEAIDAASKAANVETVGREKLGGGYICVVIKGDVAAVKAAVEAASNRITSLNLGKLIAAHVIARPSASVMALLPKA